MSYKYNHSIQFDLDHLSQYEDVVGLEEKKRELDDVYEQADKADEYEAKAKAFDNLVDVAYWHFERIHPDDDNGLQYESFYDDIRDEFKKLESGESDAKK